MNLEDRILQVITIVVMIFSAAVPIYFYLHPKGPIVPEKKVELLDIGPINPMDDLSALGEKVRLSLTIEDETIDNLVIATAYLKNTGTTSIIPGDYHENISISVLEPWKIVAVKSPGKVLTDVEFTWNKITNTRFEAEPALLNPGDRVSANIYLTNTKIKGLMDWNDYKDLELKWNARITNLKRFTKMPSILDRYKTRDYGFAIVLLTDWALPFTLVSACLFLCLYLYLLSKSALLETVSLKSIPVIAAFSLLSFAAAEVIAYYLFKIHEYPPLKYYGVTDWWLNYAVLFVHIGTIFYLYIRIVRHKGNNSST